MLDFPIAELVTPDEQVAVARCVAILAARDDKISDSERHFVEELMGQMMLLPEERDLVRREFLEPSDLVTVARGVTHREARIFLYYQAVCGAMADSVLADSEFDALAEMADALGFSREAAREFTQWVQDSLELRERGQRLLVEM
ncbi:MAG: TerB family tellurite resistance protein [Myxococcales bacterium FL481]|nr:MAG: TerB family tellurite resistance protein [Myxococcales bacterium FL481]